MGTAAKSILAVGPGFAVTAIPRIRRAAGGVGIIGGSADRAVAESVSSPASRTPAILGTWRAAGGGRVNRRGAL